MRLRVVCLRMCRERELDGGEDEEEEGGSGVVGVFRVVGRG